MTDRKFGSATDVRTESSIADSKDGGPDGGASEFDCTVVGCDGPGECDPASRRCVECLSDAACVGNMPVADSGANGVCDTARRECVQCLVDNQCSGATPVCKADRADSDRNECVECTVDAQCRPNEPVCDTTTNHCTLRCTSTDECGGREKPVCNTARQLCVECIDDSSCSGDTSQCNTETNECVECVGDSPCEALGQVCNVTSNTCGCALQANGSPMIDCGGGLCIQNRADACCPATPTCSAARPNCDPTDNLCKECVTASECPGANRTCVGGVCGCTQDSKPCADGGCIPDDQCCEACTGGRSCQEGTCACPGSNQQFVNGQCRLNQGEACTVNGTPCLTGPCVDGVCCESACNGPCMQCQAGSGRCIMPIDDAACPASINCPAPASVCQQTANITANRCQSLGLCKTAANCSTSNVPVRTACDAPTPCTSNLCGGIVPICDDSGRCAQPTVACDGIQQTVGPGVGCCLLEFGRGVPSDVVVGERYEPDLISCSEGGFFSGAEAPVFCDSQNDCANASICCMSDSGNFNSIACVQSCVESQVGDDNTAGQYRVCRSPGGGNTQCPAGRACNRTHPALPGWIFCAL